MDKYDGAVEYCLEEAVERCVKVKGIEGCEDLANSVLNKMPIFRKRFLDTLYKRYKFGGNKMLEMCNPFDNPMGKDAILGKDESILQIKSVVIDKCYEPRPKTKKQFTKWIKLAYKDYEGATHRPDSGDIISFIEDMIEYETGLKLSDKAVKQLIKEVTGE